MHGIFIQLLFSRRIGGKRSQQGHCVIMKNHNNYTSSRWSGAAFTFMILCYPATIQGMLLHMFLGSGRLCKRMFSDDISQEPRTKINLMFVYPCPLGMQLFG